MFDISAAVRHDEAMTDEPLDVDYGRAVRAARKSKGMRTQAELGDVIGRSGKMVQHYEAGRYLTPEVRALLEKALGDALGPTGDAVEAALDRSELNEWRASDVKTLYKRHLHDQRREEATG
jgi:ribosome-binding protein aMBF1 (putative translation factor)